MKRILNHE